MAYRRLRLILDSSTFGYDRRTSLIILRDKTREQKDVAALDEAYDEAGGS